MVEQVAHGLGSIPSKPDPKDFVLASAPGYANAGTVFPPSFTLPGGITPALDQDGTPECTAFATVGVKSYQEHLQTGTWKYGKASADTLYAECKAVDGLPAGTPGTYPRVALQIAQTKGVRAIDGHRYLIGPYYSLLAGGDLLTNIKQSLVYYKRPVLIALHWWAHWWSVSALANYVLNNPAGSLMVGDHEIWVYGYVDQNGKTLLRMEQSWSDVWGNRGRCYLPFDYASAPNSGLSDAWVTIDR